jgi:site-specific DNA-methyltransferase (adenine-specific)
MKMTQYLKWKADSSKGEVFTPIELVREMVDKINDEVWRNPNATFLDPCMGKGTFLLEIVRRLVYIYGYTEDDAKSRVYGYDIRVKYVNHLTRRGLKNVRHKDFLNEIIEMEFDVVLGNPPYQETDELGKSKTGGANLYTKFIRKSFEIGRYLSFIVPPTWMNSNKDEKDIFSKNQIHYLNISECKKHFSGVGSQFSYFLLEKKEVTSKTKVVCEFNKKIYNSEILLKDFNYLPMLLDESVVSLYDKITNGKEKLDVNISFKFDHRQKFISKEEDNEFIYKLKHTSKQFRYSSVIHPAQTQNKVLISRSGKLSPCYDNGELGMTDGVMWIVVENEIEGQNLINFLNSKLIRFILLVYKWNGFNEVMILKQLPKIDLSVTLTDTEIYNIFGVTENEIELIESHVE